MKQTQCVPKLTGLNLNYCIELYCFKEQTETNSRCSLTYRFPSKLLYRIELYCFNKKYETNSMYALTYRFPSKLLYRIDLFPYRNVGKLCERVLGALFPQ